MKATDEMALVALRSARDDLVAGGRMALAQEVATIMQHLRDTAAQDGSKT